MVDSCLAITKWLSGVNKNVTKMSFFVISSVAEPALICFNLTQINHNVVSKNTTFCPPYMAHMLEQNKVRIRTSDIPTRWLNARCRNLISKYALIAYRQDGIVFDLRGEKILSQLSQHSKLTIHEELREIYAQLKGELKLVVACPSLKMAVNIMAKKLDYIESNQPITNGKGNVVH